MPWLWLSEGAEDCRVHVIPIGDDIIHLEGLHCPCQPAADWLPAYHRQDKLAVRTRLIHNWIGEEEDGSKE